jgi:hypothetical protein
MKYTIQDNGGYLSYPNITFRNIDPLKINIVREELVSVSKPLDRSIVDDQLNSISHVSQYKNDRF